MKQPHIVLVANIRGHNFVFTVPLGDKVASRFIITVIIIRIEDTFDIVLDSTMKRQIKNLVIVELDKQKQKQKNKDKNV